MEEILVNIAQAVQTGRVKLVSELAGQALSEGIDAQKILNDGLIAGMSAVGEKFKKNEMYIPEVMLAAKAMTAGTALLKEGLANGGEAPCGKACIGTVKGDRHDIGKNLVRMMLEGKGIEVIDLGTDVPPEKFIDVAEKEGCDIICCSALLTTTMERMREVVRLRNERGISAKIMIGGAPVTKGFCEEIGADIYTSDAASAAEEAIKICIERESR